MWIDTNLIYFIDFSTVGMSGDVKSYFENHCHNYPKSEQFYSKLIMDIKSVIHTQRPIRLLDVGCGNGNFIGSLLNSGINFDYFSTDISFNMLKAANKNLYGKNIRFFVADAFHLPLISKLRFEVIHIDSVLHHLIANTKGKSNLLAATLIEGLVRRLTQGGILIVEEVNFSSHLIRQLTSNLVFYALKLNKFLRIDLSRIIPDLRPGLEVNFLDDKYLMSVLNQHGSVNKTHYDSYDIPQSYKAFFLKQYGHSTYFLTK